MGLYLRKSLNVGPFRFNLSKSGIGVSTGIPGLRLGAGPSGNYVHMGRGGLYYRKTFKPSANKPYAPQEVSNLNQREGDIDLALQPQYENYREIESGAINAMVDSSSKELLEEFSQKRKRLKSLPWVVGVLILFFIISSANWSLGMCFGYLAVAGMLTYCAHSYDQIRKCVVLFYDMDEQYENAFEKVHAAFDVLKNTQKVWHVASEADVIDKKRNAGANQVISRQEIKISYKNAPFVKTNINIPSINVGKQNLYFFPDRLLVFENDEIGAVSYGDLNMQIIQSRFIEDGSVPKDAKIIDYTWLYINKSGGPDRRFSNNRQIPICLYEDLNFTSSNGLCERVEFSKVGVSEGFHQAIKGIANLV